MHENVQSNSAKNREHAERTPSDKIQTIEKQNKLVRYMRDTPQSSKACQNLASEKFHIRGCLSTADLLIRRQNCDPPQFCVPPRRSRWDLPLLGLRRILVQTSQSQSPEMKDKTQHFKTRLVLGYSNNVYEGIKKTVSYKNIKERTLQTRQDRRFSLYIDACRMRKLACLVCLSEEWRGFPLSTLKQRLSMKQSRKCLLPFLARFSSP